MRPALLLVAAFVVLAGCSARGAQDPFAFTRKDLAHTSFDLSAVGPKGDEQDFRVEDGSIATIRLQVWVNETAGDATVDIISPSGRAVLATQHTTEATVPVDLGVWRIVVHAAAGTAGDAAVVATRAGTSVGAT